MNATQQKPLLRAKLRNQRRKLTASQQQKHGEQLASHLQGCHWFADAQYIALYLPIDGEISPQLFIDVCWSAGKNIYLPVTSGNGMDFATYTPDVVLVENQYGIPEPKATQLLPVEKLDVVIVPMVAFDKQKRRLGRGGGYYDKTLKNARDSTLKIGVAHAMQEIDVVPTEPHDVLMDYIVTEKGIFKNR